MKATASQPRILKHQVVRTQVEALVDTLAEGDPVPAERELATRFDVSRETVRAALRELLVAGRIERRGRGTVIAGPKVVQPLILGSYTEAALAAGLSVGRELVGWTDLTADEALAADLDVEPGVPILELERVLLVDGVRVGLERTRLPAHRFAGLDEDFDHTSSLYAAIRSRGIEFARAVERIEAAMPDAREAALLDADPRTPMLLLSRVSYDRDDVPIEHRRSLYRGDRMAFVANVAS